MLLTLLWDIFANTWSKDRKVYIAGWCMKNQVPNREYHRICLPWRIRYVNILDFDDTCQIFEKLNEK